MNYISEILAFQGFAQDKSLSSGQIALWYALMYINNRSQWQEWFTVANKSLESNSGLSRQGIAKARNALKQLGLIDFKPRGTKATAYKMITTSESSQDSCQDSCQDGCQDGCQVGCQVGCQDGSTLNKQNKTKQNKNIIPSVSPLSAAVESYEENIGPVTRMIAEDMDYFIRQGMEEQVLIRAIRKSVDANVRKWSYVKGILRSLLNQGIKTAKEWEQNDGGGNPKGNVCRSSGESGKSDDGALKGIGHEC